ncbi:Twin-arginine translocation pathway signal [Aureimonas sp. Leaf454]|uniref:gluconate 2-dehydrogenase subunit 3 family protein n=1 Tax=Aureimonas sp. Leaf454 TaxID=1736381 RepID=UPI0006FB07DE|nr:gluconate 2-dehydrogenase subunit 3 family protein [Aureimonas sp. Leaf454]KQT47450.1 Twin-arginine translocation pathway signal [Aureimonas sp. Leaf454]
MTKPDLQAAGLSRRRFLQGVAGSTLLAMTIGPDGLVSGKAWAQMPKATKPETFASLVQMSRDCYPHDKIEDTYYANAVTIIDEAARSSPEQLALLEDGMAALDKAAADAHGSPYAKLAREEDRVALLKAIEEGPFFQKVRGNLVVGFYNQKELWPIFGYEGASFDKGGYIERGFDDISWLA